MAKNCPNKKGEALHIPKKGIFTREFQLSRNVIFPQLVNGGPAKKVHRLQCFQGLINVHGKASRLIKGVPYPFRISWRIDDIITAQSRYMFGVGHPSEKKAYGLGSGFFFAFPIYHFTNQKSKGLAVLTTNQVHRFPLDIEGGGVEERDRLHPVRDIPSDVALLIEPYLHATEDKRRVKAKN